MGGRTSAGLTGTPGGGLLLALVSAATFGTSGAFASSLLDAGWSSSAAVLVRVGVAALVLAPVALWQVRGRGHVLRANLWAVVGFGAFAVAACQVFYFNAVQHLAVGVALLLEYLGSVLVVGWLWLRHGQRPRRLTLIGAATAIAGLVAVLDVWSGVRIDVVGVLWGLGAATGLAVYFVLSAHTDERLPPLVMAWGGLTVGAVLLGLAGAAGVAPLHASTGDVRFAGHAVSWVLPVAGLSLVAAVVAYVTGIAGTRLLGARLATFVGLTEVVFAVLVAWVLLGQLPTAVQLAGGVVIVAGVALVRIDELRPAPAEAGTAAGVTGTAEPVLPLKSAG